MSYKGVKGPIFIHTANPAQRTGIPPTSRRNDICDELIVPLGSLLFVFAICAAVILFS